MTSSLITVLGLIGLLGAVWFMVPAMARPQLPFGVRVPPDRIGDPAVSVARAGYQRRLVILVAAGAAVAPVVAVIAEASTVSATVVPAVGIIGAFNYWLAHRAVRRAKRDGDWYAGARQAVTADTSLRTDPPRPQWWWMVPGVLVVAATAVIGGLVYPDLPATLPSIDQMGDDAPSRTDTTFFAAFAPVFAQVALTALTPLMVVAMRRSRPELDASAPAASARRWRTYLTGATTMVLIGAVAGNVTLMLVAVRLWELAGESVWVSVLTYLPLIVAAAAFIGFEIRVGHAGHRIRLKPGDGGESSGRVQRDDDRHWYLGGFVYVNRRDTAIMVHMRAVPLSWTLNLGHPVSWLLLAVTAVVILLAATGVIDWQTT